MPVASIASNDTQLTLEYDTFGDATQPPLLLISGIGSQRIESWDSRLCEQLGAVGLYVLRFENRDSRSDCESPPGYTLADMARDTLQMVDATLGEDAAFHVMGFSMGGMIAQAVAISQPQRVATLTSVAAALKPSFTSISELLKKPQVGLALGRLLTDPPLADRADFIEQRLKLARTLNQGAKYPLDENRLREVSGEAFDRGPSRDGAQRQMAAIRRSGSRRKALRHLRVRTMIIHGGKDPMMPYSAGKETADAIPRAEFLGIPGMGHFLPEGVWPELVESLRRFAQ